MNIEILPHLSLGVVEIGGNRDHGVGHLLAQVGLSGLLHLGEDHGGDLLGGERLLSLTSSLHFDVGLGHLLDHLEGIKLDISLDSLVSPLSSDHPLGVKHRVLGVAGQLVLSGVSNLGENASQASVRKENFNLPVVLPQR